MLYLGYIYQGKLPTLFRIAPKREQRLDSASGD